MRPRLATGTDTLDEKKLLKVLTDFRRGDFSARLPVDQVGTAGKIYDTLNDVIDLKADGNIAVISVNSPPVNALSQNVREGLPENGLLTVREPGAAR